MNAIIAIRSDRPVKELQNDFNKVYPYLKLDFYIPGTFGRTLGSRQFIIENCLLKAAGVRKDGDLVVSDTMLVSELTKVFRERFGALIQVSRQSGRVWLETTKTTAWTLKQQNDHGQQLSGQFQQT
jgi:hypothetical protein